MSSNFNGSVCDFLARFLNNGPKTSDYDWRNATENLNEFFDAVYTYGNVSSGVNVHFTLAMLNKLLLRSHSHF